MAAADVCWDDDEEEEAGVKAVTEAFWLRCCCCWLIDAELFVELFVIDVL